MSFVSQQPIASGVGYTINETNGERPGSLDQFVGTAVFVIDVRGELRTIEGSGSFDGKSVRFYEKHGGTGKDIRVWRITAGSDCSFTACHETAWQPSKAS